MQKFYLRLLVSISLVFLFFTNQTLSQVLPISLQKKVCITFDDLPFVRPKNDKELKGLTIKLINAINNYKIPAVGFVNASKLENAGVLSVDRLDALNLWLENNLVLGNHTYSHPSYNEVGTEQFFTDVIKGEKYLKELIAKHGEELVYFRHPYLHTGRSIAKRDSLQMFLQGRGYIVAPITIDNSDWIYALAFDKALDSGDTILAAKIGRDFISYIIAKVKYFESNSLQLFNRNISHVLLLHANRINANYFDAVASALQEYGYTFVSLKDALKDTAYQSEDTYIGGWGFSWLHRWAKTKGMPKTFYMGEPKCPEFVLKTAGIEEE